MCPFRVTIVGAGLTGSLTACRLKRIFKDDVSITLVEKSRGAGGRMSTNRFSSSKDRPNNLTCDLGAQYVSATPQYYEKHKSFYDELVAAGALKEFDGKIIGANRFSENATHYISPSGISSIVKHFLHQSESEVKFNTTIEQININDNLLTMKSKEHAEEIQSNAVVFTIPVPQILNQKGSIENLMKPYMTELSHVEYSSRYAMALYYTEDLPVDIPWACNYISDDECLRFISVDTKKRGVDGTSGTSITAHTSVPFGIKHLEQDFGKVEPLLMASLKKQVPGLPEPDGSKCQRWRYSQVHKPYPGRPGCLVLNNSPMLIAGGDSFTQSNFDGCIESSTAIIENLSELMKAKL